MPIIFLLTIKDNMAYNVLEKIIRNRKLYLWCLVFGVFNLCSSQTKVILDTDFDSDVDDVQALGMLHSYQAAGKIDLIGVVVTSDDSYSYKAVSAINTYYGSPNTPIGYLKKQKDTSNFSKYTKQISIEFSHRISSSEEIQESSKLYRKLLSESNDSSVVIVTIGHLTSLQNLLQSKGDEISPLDGEQLVNKKVKKWLCMGGTYPQGKEANFYRPDPESTSYCIANWKKEVVFCGWEVGNQILTGGDYLKENLDMQNPIYRSYELFNNFSGRPAWDQVAVMLLDKKISSSFFDVNTNGYVSIKKDGSNQWHSGKKKTNKEHAYVSIKRNISPKVIAKTIDDLIGDMKVR